MNDLTLKVDIVSSQLKEGQQILAEIHRRLAEGQVSLRSEMEVLAGFVKQVAALQIDQDGRIPPRTSTAA